MRATARAKQPKSGAIDPNPSKRSTNAPDWRIGWDIDTPRAVSKFYQSLVEYSSDIVSIHSEDGVLLYATPAFQRILGRKTEDWIGKNMFDLIHPADHPFVRDAFTRVVQSTNSHLRTKFRLRHADGSWIPVDCAGGQPEHAPIVGGVVISMRDISVGQYLPIGRHGADERDQHTGRRGQD